MTNRMIDKIYHCGRNDDITDDKIINISRVRVNNWVNINVM